MIYRAVLFACVLASLSAEARGQTSRDSEGVSLSGLLIDHTLTPQGRRFYKTFSTEWRLMVPRDDFNILVQELPDPARSSQIRIIWNHRTLYTTFLGPARNKLLKKAKQAAKTVNNQLLYIRILEAAQWNPDLDKDEL